MAVQDSFSLQAIDDVLRNKFPFFRKNKLEYSIRECDGSKRVSILEVKGETTIQQYVVIQICNDPTIVEKHDIKYSSVLQPEFIMKNNRNEMYGAFEKVHINNLEPPQGNNFNHLKIILKTLAHIQAASSVNLKSDLHQKPFESIADMFTSEYFKHIEEYKINDIVKQLEMCSKTLIKSKLLVKSIWSFRANNVYINNDTADCVFLDISSQQWLPPTYDALLYVFSLSDESFRKKHFECLIDYYFRVLTDSLKEQNNELCGEEVTRHYAESQVRNLLPLAKIKIAKTEESMQQKEILANILNYVQYPLIQQEDIYEITRNKLRSNNYELLSYKLVPLIAKNGHLGKYFQLKITVKLENRTQELNLFAKYLITSTDVMQDIIETGVGEREDFFYNNLLARYRNYGLDSLLDFAPKCYLCRFNWFFVFDDLENLGYEAVKPNTVLNFNGLKIVLSKIAQFHVCSLILEEMLSKEAGNDVRLDEEYKGYFDETILKYEGPMKVWYDGALTALNYILHKCPELRQKFNRTDEQLRTKLNDIMLGSFTKVKRSNTVRNVINHGDLYVANTLFKFGDNKEIRDAILIDFQMLRYISPAYEVLFFIFLNSTRETRVEHMNALLDFYYEELSSHLTTFGLNPETIMSRKEFDDDIRYVKCASFAAAFTYGHVNHVDPDFREEMFHDQVKMDYYLKHKEKYMDEVWPEERYQHVMKGLVEDLVDIVESDV